AAWEILPRVPMLRARTFLDPNFVSLPSLVAARLWETTFGAKAGYLWLHAGASLGAALAGFVAGAPAGLPRGPPPAPSPAPAGPAQALHRRLLRGAAGLAGTADHAGVRPRHRLQDRHQRLHRVLRGVLQLLQGRQRAAGVAPGLVPAAGRLALGVAAHGGDPV